jgi:dihydrofolate reductase
VSKVRFEITMSIDGFIAGPEQSEEEPLGIGGEALHEWAFALAAWREMAGLEGGEENASTVVMEGLMANVGAGVMGRNMFGPIRGPWGDRKWEGWWGEEPPYHHPVYVLTHHAREPLEMKGGTTFIFVTDGIESAIAQAEAAAGDKEVLIHGGGSVAQQALAAGLVDEVHIHLVPLMLGAGVRLFERLGDPLPRFEQFRVIEAPGVTHLSYRVNR